MVCFTLLRSPLVSSKPAPFLSRSRGQTSRRSPDRCWSLADVYTHASLGTADRESTVVVWVTLTPACWCSPSRKTKFLSRNLPDFSETSWAVRTLYSWTEEARQVSIRRSRGGRAIWCRLAPGSGYASAPTRTASEGVGT